MQRVYARLGAVVVLLGLLGGLTVWAGTLGPTPEVGAYPSQDDLVQEYDRYLGQRAVVDGTVISTTPFMIDATADTGETMRLTIVDLDIAVERGEIVRVYGIVEADATIRALNAYTVSRHGLWYTWTVSFLAGLWVLTRIVRQWRIDSDRWALEPRPTSLSWRIGIPCQPAAADSEEADTDA